VSWLSLTLPTNDLWTAGTKPQPIQLPSHRVQHGIAAQHNETKIDAVECNQPDSAAVRLCMRFNKLWLQFPQGATTSGGPSYTYSCQMRQRRCSRVSLNFCRYAQRQHHGTFSRCDTVESASITTHRPPIYSSASNDVKSFLLCHTRPLLLLPLLLLLPTPWV
jgi:hypothetical protein